eukprot:GHVT01033679.1.p1 GENE.GHVT01033679.1~~GHVT01033679.1.p1  ORF type:complete len:644 (+),score=78.71 GHVT01033679.1:3415-5346(+)
MCVCYPSVWQFVRSLALFSDSKCVMVELQAGEDENVLAKVVGTLPPPGRVRFGDEAAVAPAASRLVAVAQHPLRCEAFVAVGIDGGVRVFEVETGGDSSLLEKASDEGMMDADAFEFASGPLDAVALVREVMQDQVGMSPGGPSTKLPQLCRGAAPEDGGRAAGILDRIMDRSHGQRSSTRSEIFTCSAIDAALAQTQLSAFGLPSAVPPIRQSLKTTRLDCDIPFVSWGPAAVDALKHAETDSCDGDHNQPVTFVGPEYDFKTAGLRPLAVTFFRASTTYTSMVAMLCAYPSELECDAVPDAEFASVQFSKFYVVVIDWVEGCCIDVIPLPDLMPQPPSGSATQASRKAWAGAFRLLPLTPRRLLVFGPDTLVVATAPELGPHGEAASFGYATSAQKCFTDPGNAQGDEVKRCFTAAACWSIPCGPGCRLAGATNLGNRDVSNSIGCLVDAHNVNVAVGDSNGAVLHLLWDELTECLSSIGPHPRRSVAGTSARVTNPQGIASFLSQGGSAISPAVSTPAQLVKRGGQVEELLHETKPSGGVPDKSPPLPHAQQHTATSSAAATTRLHTVHAANHAHKCTAATKHDAHLHSPWILGGGVVDAVQLLDPERVAIVESTGKSTRLTVIKPSTSHVAFTVDLCSL